MWNEDGKPSHVRNKEWLKVRSVNGNWSWRHSVISRIGRDTQATARHANNSTESWPYLWKGLGRTWQLSQRCSFSKEIRGFKNKVSHPKQCWLSGFCTVWKWDTNSTTLMVHLHMVWNSWNTWVSSETNSELSYRNIPTAKAVQNVHKELSPWKVSLCSKIKNCMIIWVVMKGTQNT